MICFIPAFFKPLPAFSLAAIGLILYGMRLDLKSLLPAEKLAVATMLEDYVWYLQVKEKAEMITSFRLFL